MSRPSLSLMITMGIAVYGAILSTAIFARDLWSRRARARVTSGYRYDPTNATSDPGFVLVAQIANRGREPIFLARCALDIGGLGIVQPDLRVAQEHLPAELRAGQGFSLRFDAVIVANFAAQRPSREVRVVYWDQLGRRYRGPIFVAATVGKLGEVWTLDTPKRASLVRRLLGRLSSGRSQQL